MSISLKLMIVENAGANFAFVRTCLQIEEVKEFYDNLINLSILKGKSVPDEFNCGEARDATDKMTIYGNVQEDSYGDPLKTLTVAQLLKFAEDNPAILSNFDARAAWAYLAVIKPETRVALYWH